MKKLWFLLIGAVLGGIMGWALGFLRLPLVDHVHAFWVGFIGCLALVALIIYLLVTWNRHKRFLSLISKNPSTDHSSTITRAYLTVWILVAVFIVMGVLGSSIMIYRQSKIFATQTQKQNKLILEQSQVIESVRKSSQIQLMSNVLDDVEDELKLHSNGSISDATIARIATLSYSFKPYRYLIGDSLSEKMLSPERGQLLMALVAMNLDSTSFARIKRRVTFSRADLQQAELKGADLSGINLNEANLRDANLQGINMSYADLGGTDLWGANLSQANLSYTDFKNADMKWANLNESYMVFANLRKADLTNAKFRNADLREVWFNWATLDGAAMNNANIAGGDFLYTSLKKTNFQQANLNEARLKGAVMNDANLTEVVIRKVAVDKNWLDQLTQWHITGGSEIIKEYMIEMDTSYRYKYEKYFLNKKKQATRNTTD